MEMKSLSLVRLACFAALSCMPLCFASPKGRSVEQPSLVQNVHARQWSNTSFPLTQAPPDPSSTLPDRSPTSQCTPYGCNLFYQSVNIYYWPTEPQNTACFASLPSPAPTPAPPGLNMVAPSIYAIFPSIMASDGCKQIGKGYGPITTSFAPGELSTIEGHGASTAVYNFADLPCPPSGIDLRAGETYAPLLAPPSFIWGLDPEFAGCIPGYNQGLDPPTAETADAGPDGNGGVGQGARRRDVPAHAHPHITSWGPKKTPEPAHNMQF